GRMQRERHQPERVHRMDRLRNLTAGIVVVAAVGCGKGDGPKPEPMTPRTAVVTGESDPNALKTFCDKSWPGEGAVQPWGGGPAKKLDPKTPNSGGWRWVNFWATW